MRRLTDGLNMSLIGLDNPETKHCQHLKIQITKLELYIMYFIFVDLVNVGF